MLCSATLGFAFITTSAPVEIAHRPTAIGQSRGESKCASFGAIAPNFATFAKSLSGKIIAGVLTVLIQYLTKIQLAFFAVQMTATSEQTAQVSRLVDIAIQKIAPAQDLSCSARTALAHNARAKTAKAESPTGNATIDVEPKTAVFKRTPPSYIRQ
jgi:hypothetical protein